MIKFLIALFFIVTVIASFDLGPLLNSIMPILSVISLFLATWLHGLNRYGWKEMLVFFAITWVISHAMEAISIQTGFPFGHYHYEKLGGPRIFEVPIVIMFAYFGMIYLSWTLSQILTRWNVVFTPIIATFVMVMWDLAVDPLSSTIASLWVWEQGGTYFGVPLQNYFGWFLTVYLIFQVFALYVQGSGVLSKTAKVEAIVLYGIQSLVFPLSFAFVNSNSDIYGPMALVSFFTMGFVVVLSLVKVYQEDPVRL